MRTKSKQSPENKRLIILDRDGVINQQLEGYISRPEDWQPIDGSIEAIVDLYRRGYRFAIATNQAGIGRGVMTVDDLLAVHKKMLLILAVYRVQIEAVFFCPHTPEDGCKCRKPETGLLESIAKRLDVRLSDTLFIGDSMRDVQAALAVGAKPMMVRTGRGAVESEQAPEGVPIYDDLSAVADAILGPLKRKSKSKSKRKGKKKHTPLAVEWRRTEKNPDPGPAS